MSQYWNYNLLNQLSNSYYLDNYNDLVIFLELIIVLSVLILIISIIFNKFFQNFKHWIMMEMIWTISPSLILLILGFPSIKMIYSMEFSNFFSDFTIKIMGYQWYWNYSFPELNLNFDSFPNLISKLFRLGESNLLILPMKVNLRFLISSNDVIHSWTIPALSMKMDAIPGRLNMLSTQIMTMGKFMGQCSELCGNYHSWMPIYMESSSLLMFNSWLMNF